LLPDAFVKEMLSPFPFRRSLEKGMLIFPLRYFDVVLLPFKKVDGSPSATYVTTMTSCTWPNVQNVVGREHHFFVVFDDYH
jgi:hypothetical protein